MLTDKEKTELSSLYGTLHATDSKYYDFNRLQKYIEERLTFKLLERSNHGKANKSRSNRQG